MNQTDDKHGELVALLRHEAEHGLYVTKVAADLMRRAANALSARSATDSTQEPVAWMHDKRPGDIMPADQKRYWLNEWPKQADGYTIPLYLHPSAVTEIESPAPAEADAQIPNLLRGYWYPSRVLRLSTVDELDALCELLNRINGSDGPHG